MSEPAKLKCIEITPAVSASVDSQVFVVSGDTWKDALDAIESALDRQFNDVPWDEIQITVRGLEMTQEELDEITEED